MTAADPTQIRSNCHHRILFPAKHGNDEDWRAELNKRLHREINDWIQSLCEIGSGSEDLKRHIESLFPPAPDGRRQSSLRARTVRMLMLLGALFDDAEPDKNNHWNPYIDDAREMRSRSEFLDKALKELKEITLPAEEPTENTSPAEEKVIPLVLLLVLAVAHSQCQNSQPIAWEAYSAGMTWNALWKDWTEVDGTRANGGGDKAVKIEGRSRAALSIVALIVRYQSGAGQLARCTGTATFQQRLRSILDNKVATHLDLEPSEERWERIRKGVEDVLRVMGVIEEARNRRVPGEDEHPTTVRLEANRGVSLSWTDPTWYLLKPSAFPSLELKSPRVCRRASEVEALLNGEMDRLGKSEMGPIETAEAIFNPPILPSTDNQEYTWAFASKLDVPEDRMNEFKRKAEKYVRSLGDAPHEDTISHFAFDRRQVRRIETALSKYVERVATRDELDNWFVIQTYEIPHSLGGSTPEHVIEVRLKDSFAAYQMLFKGKPLPKVASDETKDDHPTTELEKLEDERKTAGELLVWLFENAREHFELEACSLSGAQPYYLPHSLMRRMLATVYALRPRTCVHAEVRYDGKPAILVPLPEDLGHNPPSELVECLAHYVPAFVLNRAMSLGFKTCDVGLGGLRRRRGADDEEGEPGLDWVSLIRSAFDKNAYDLLADRYLRDYNTERHAVQFIEAVSETVQPISVQEIPRVLSKFLTDSGRDGSPFRVLGVDLGGTFAKFRHYTFDIGDERLEPVGSRAFRVSTPDVHKLEEGDKTARFVGALIEAVDNQTHTSGEISRRELSQVSAVGISWPGPVRGHYVMGTSGIVVRFGLSRGIAKNRIEDIMAIDVLGAFQKEWRKRFLSGGGSPPTVALLNDGSAEGIGVVHDLNSPGTDTMPSLVNGGLAVVKLGTGTAGAVFDGGQIFPGLAEWGKVLLNLALVPKGGYPEGLANHHLSAKALCSLARHNGNKEAGNDVDERLPVLRGPPFQSVRLDGHDVGLLAEYVAARKIAWLRDELLPSMGCRQYASSCPPNVDAEVVRTVLEEGGLGAVDQEAARTLEQMLGGLGDEATKGKLKEKVSIFGGTRLEEIAQVDGNSVSTLMNDPPKLTEDLQDVLNLCGTIARNACRILGNYVGDFLVLLRDLYEGSVDLSCFVVTGGVLSSRTGELVREQARERAAMYGLDLEIRGSIFCIESKATTIDSSPSQKVEFGTLGAAIFATGKFLQEKKQEGLEHFKSRLVRLESNDTVIVESGEVKFPPASAESTEGLKYDDYALSKEEMVQFMEHEAVDLGFYRSVARGGHVSDRDLVFRRWMIGKGLE